MVTRYEPPENVLRRALLAAPSLQAQVVNDGATRTLSNETNSITGHVTVGTNGSFTLLVLADNALLTNSAHGVIGRNATARSNEAQLASPSARWRMGNFLYVGSNDSMSRLVVSNGAFLENLIGVLGQTTASSNNFALVTGSGSRWTNRNDLRIGNSGQNNQMIVSNGGWVTRLNGGIGQSVGSSNFVLVTGSSSVWLIPDLFVMGDAGTGNRLRVSDGASLNSGVASVGLNSGSRNTDVLVTGTGSSWKCDILRFGFSGQRNMLVITNGDEVLGGAFDRFVNELGIIAGQNGFSTNNRVIVDGGTLTAANLTRRVVLDIRRGTNVLNAGLMDVDQLLLTNTQGLIEFNGGTLITRGANIDNTRPFAVGGPGGTLAVLGRPRGHE